MMFENLLIYFVIIPLVVLGVLAICRNMAQIRTISVIGATALVGLAAWVTAEYLGMRAAGDNSDMLFQGSWMWFEPLNIHLALGIDGISVVMLILSAIIVFAGVFASWRMDPLPKEYFMWFWLLSIGVFGFFISIDLFTMFMFYEVALIPMYLLIGVWGSGNKDRKSVV